MVIQPRRHGLVGLSLRGTLLKAIKEAINHPQPQAGQRRLDPKKKLTVVGGPKEGRRGDHIFGSLNGDSLVVRSAVECAENATRSGESLASSKETKDFRTRRLSRRFAGPPNVGAV